MKIFINWTKVESKVGEPVWKEFGPRDQSTGSPDAGDGDAGFIAQACAGEGCVFGSGLGETTEEPKRVIPLIEKFGEKNWKTAK